MRLDQVALEHVLRLAIAREIQHPAAIFLERLGDRKQHRVAQAAADYVAQTAPAGSIIGVGTGSTANFFIDALAPLKDRYKGAVASSEATRKRLEGHGIKVLSLFFIDAVAKYRRYDEAGEQPGEYQPGKTGERQQQRPRYCWRWLPASSDSKDWRSTCPYSEWVGWWAFCSRPSAV